MNHPKVSIIIVSWNTEKYLKACLESITSNILALTCEIFVVDNNSRDGSAYMVASDFPAVKLIRNTANIGFARANNIAIALSSGSYVLVLNPDTGVPPGAVEKMTEFMERHPGVGACGPKILDGKGRPAPWKLRLATLRESFGRDTVLGKMFPQVFGRVQQTAICPDKPEKVEWIHGCCMLVRKKTIQEIGMMEEKLFLTFEEQDWCLRMHENNWETYYFPASEIIHYVGESRKQTSDLADHLHMRRSEYVFFRKRYGLLPVLCLRGFVSFSSLAILLKWIGVYIIRREKSSVLGKIRFYTALFWVSLGIE